MELALSMRISVAMCTYNGAHYLQEMLDSVAAQTLPPFEVVICDDGSTDATLTMLEAFRRRTAFPVRLFRNAINLGHSRNFAQAIQLCTGDVIALADQDDTWYPRKLERLADVFRADPTIEGAFSDGDVMDEASQPTGRTLWQSFLFDAADQARLRSGQAVDVLLRRNVVTGMAFAFRSSATDLLSPMPASWDHDAWLAMRIAMRSRLTAVTERLVSYRVHGTQQVGTPLPPLKKLQAFRQNGLRVYLQGLHALNLKHYQIMARQFDDMLAWLQASSQDRVLEAKVRAKAEHALRGVRALSLKRLRRIPMLVPHVRQYARFSPNGLRGLPRDLVAEAIPCVRSGATLDVPFPGKRT